MAAVADGFPAVVYGVQSLLAHARTRGLANDRPGPQRPASKKNGYDPTPATLTIDSQTVKTNYEGEQRGFHGGKRVKGRSRQIAVDSQGQIWAVPVHAANLADTKKGCVLADEAMPRLPSVKAWNARRRLPRKFCRAPQNPLADSGAHQPTHRRWVCRLAQTLGG